MSRRSSRSSTMDQGELFLDCKAAYLSIYDSIKEKIDSSEALLEVMQQTGRNPSSRVLKKYWTYDTEELSFDDFVDICKKEPVTSSDDLMKAFRKIDINGDGYISLDELHKILTSKGEKKSRSEVKKMIDDVDENKDGKLDYKEFCKMVVSTAEESKKMQRKLMERKEKKRRMEIERKGDVAPGSQVSLRSSASNKRDVTGSQISVKSQAQVSKSQVSLKSETQPIGYQVSLKSAVSPRRDVTGSQISVKSQEQVSKSQISLKPEAQPMGSQVSLKPESQPKGSQVSLKSEAQPMGSKVSLQFKSKPTGSQVSIKSEAQPMGSQVSLKSAVSTRTRTKSDAENDDIQEECETARSDKPTPSPRKSIDKPEDVSGSTASLQSKDEVLLTSRRSSRSQKNTGRSNKDRESLSSSRLSTSRDKLADPNPPDDMGSNVSLTSASGLMIKQNQKNVGTPAGSRKSSLLSIGEGSYPIPAQRKSLLHTASNLDQDDLPKPSPRVKKDKSRQAPALKNIRLDEPKNLREWTHTRSKGSFFLEDGSMMCHQYNFDIPDDSKVWITIQPLNKGSDGSPVDTSVFILRDKPDDDGNLLVAFSEQRDAKGKYGVSCELSSGKYYIMPYTTGCRFKARKSDPPKEAKLVTQDKDGKYVMTKAFRKVLEDIFDSSDLDCNGLMSRKEFNLYNIRTSGEEVADEEWQVVEDRIELEDGEITKTGFLHLNELEVEDSEGDPEDLWTTLTSMGYNKQLVMDQACLFQLDVYTEDCDDAELDVVRVDTYPTYPGDQTFEDIICKSFINHGEISRVKGMKDLGLYTYINDGWASLVLDNKSHSRVRVELDCSYSSNVVSNHDSLQRTLRVDPGASVIAFNLTPEDDSRDWQIKCTETIR